MNTIKQLTASLRAAFVISEPMQRLDESLNELDKVLDERIQRTRSLEGAVRRFGREL